MAATSSPRTRASRRKAFFAHRGDNTKAALNSYNGYKQYAKGAFEQYICRHAPVIDLDAEPVTIRTSTPPAHILVSATNLVCEVGRLAQPRTSGAWDAINGVPVPGLRDGVYCSPGIDDVTDTVDDSNDGDDHAEGSDDEDADTAENPSEAADFGHLAGVTALTEYVRGECGLRYAPRISFDGDGAYNRYPEELRLPARNRYRPRPALTSETLRQLYA